MSAKAIWAAAPAVVRQAPAPTLVQEPKSPQQDIKQKQQAAKVQLRAPGIVPPAQRCKHNLEQPRTYIGTGHWGDAISSQKTTCYRCTFVCFKCGNDVTGICEDCF